MTLLKDIAELVNAGIISQETAEKIKDYYKGKKASSSNRLFIVFGILGAILVGLGVILIIAHNWDELSRSTKTFFAFLPLIAGQLACTFVLIKKRDSVAWREGSAAFLFFAVGASISLVSQIYNIPGNLSSFVMTWMLLCVPLIYLMKSSVVSLLYLIGITYYACETSYWGWPTRESYMYWLMLLLALPHYFILYKKKPTGNFMIYHNWLIPLSVVITLGTISGKADELMYIAYFSLFGLLYLVGDLDFFAKQRLLNNGFKIVGSLGTIILLLTLSFDWFWEDLRRGDLYLDKLMLTPEFLASAVISLAAVGLLYVSNRYKPLYSLNPLGLMFILFIITFLIGTISPIAAPLINLYVFVFGIMLIRVGARKDHLGILNYGLMVITALVICRFFDTDLSFVVRGVLFVSVGVGFFATNYWLLKKRRSNG